MQILYKHRITPKDGQHVLVDALIDALKCSYTAVIIFGPYVVDGGEFRAEGELVKVLERVFPRLFSESMESAYGPLAFVRLWCAVGKHSRNLIYQRNDLFLPSADWVNNLPQIHLILEINAPLLGDHSRHRYRGGVSAKAKLWTNAARCPHLSCSNKTECA